MSIVDTCDIDYASPPFPEGVTEYRYTQSPHGGNPDLENVRNWCTSCGDNIFETFSQKRGVGFRDLCFRKMAHPEGDPRNPMDVITIMLREDLHHVTFTSKTERDGAASLLDAIDALVYTSDNDGECFSLGLEEELPHRRAFPHSNEGDNAIFKKFNEIHQLLDGGALVYDDEDDGPWLEAMADAIGLSLKKRRDSRLRRLGQKFGLIKTDEAKDGKTVYSLA